MTSTYLSLDHWVPVGVKPYLIVVLSCMFHMTNDCNGHLKSLLTFHGFSVPFHANSDWLVVGETPHVERMYTHRLHGARES